MVEKGEGPAVVMIPGIQGRWEWMEPAVTSLASRCRVISDSLAGDRGSAAGIDPSRGFDGYLEWVDTLLDRAKVERAAICGVSYGGFVALHYAARRSRRVSSLILVSTPSPRWKPSCQIERYLRAPRLMSPIFALSSPFRLYPEIVQALPHRADRGRFAVKHLYRVTRYPCAPRRMAQRVRMLEGVDLHGDCLRVTAPTLVVTGVAGLDRVVPVDSTREYLSAIPGASHAQIEGTGHIGLVTKPDRFSDIVGRFVVGGRERQRLPLQVSA